MSNVSLKKIKSLGMKIYRNKKGDYFVKKSEVLTILANKNNEIVIWKGKFKTSNDYDFPNGYMEIEISIPKEGYLADLTIEFIKKPVNEDYKPVDDEQLKKNIHKILKQKGYKGQDLYNAESGMQDYDKLVLEPTDEFSDWVIEKYNFIDINPD